MSFALPAESVFLDLSERAKLRLTGSDRLRFLNGQVSNDVRRATADTSVYTGVMTAKGKLSADAFIHAGDDFLLLDAGGELRESLAARLERYIIADDVQIDDVTGMLGLFHVLDFAEVMDAAASPALPAMLADLAPTVHAVHSERYGHRGLDLFFETAQAAAVHGRLSAAGVTLLNEDALESLRILLGVPLWGAELDENTMPAEAGLEQRAVSYTKGCYIGQEVVSRVKSVGHINRQLRGLRALDSSPLYAGMVLRPTENAPVGKDAGRITSAAPSAGHGGAEFVALGYVRRGWEAPGTLLDAVLPPEPLDTSGEPEAAGSPETPPPCRVEVCSLPFS